MKTRNLLRPAVRLALFRRDTQRRPGIRKPAASAGRLGRTYKKIGPASRGGSRAEVFSYEARVSRTARGMSTREDLAAKIRNIPSLGNDMTPNAETRAQGPRSTLYSVACSDWDRLKLSRARFPHGNHGSRKPRQ